MAILLDYIKLLFLNKKEKELFYFIKYQLGFTPKSLYYYEKSLTHKSMSRKDDRGIIISNERLEFLGDSVLDCVLAEYLFTRYPDKDEGYLTQMRSKIVNRKSLNDIALGFRLNKYLVANKLHSETNNALGNAFEALIGAIFLDKGFECAKTFIVKKVLEKHYDFNFLEKIDNNYKSKLIELSQRNKLSITFDTIEAGVDNKGKAVFTAFVTYNNAPFCSATGYSKKDAEQSAAKIAIQKLQQD